ncbi:astacin-like [Cherax quadricarinatus]|uniref:astacin-like n=1 Tax=Cherax quadricarinatus TaxID=27406 RepID=UPI00387E8F69
MCRSAVVMVMLACAGCALARVLPHSTTDVHTSKGDQISRAAHTIRDTHSSRGAHTSKGANSLKVVKTTRTEPFLRLSKVDSSKFPNIPDYVFKNVMDDPPEAQRLLLEEHQDPEVIAGFFQGDMAGLTLELLGSSRVGLNWKTFPERRWNNATVPYLVSDLYLPSEREMIERAVATLNFMTCVRFVPWDGSAQDYLTFVPVKQPAGCWSFVGKRGGQQVVSLQAPDSHSKRCFTALGKPIHEILHALGIFHEQARADRDEHITIITKNIIPEYINNFGKVSVENTTLSYNYDYNSVMHYGDNFFRYDNICVMNGFENRQVEELRHLGNTWESLLKKRFATQWLHQSNTK